MRGAFRALATWVVALAHSTLVWIPASLIVTLAVIVEKVACSNSAEFWPIRVAAGRLERAEELHYPDPETQNEKGTH